ncbi:kinase [Hirsutella rhossiliensis]|uniref:Kinase n=1 Tax=Hirsutella rhossiliensis TaxID=111463 RepID=A0A9P8MY74_9HYPO|nr:kinase [Hirsutella rhossiliensis]KAH0963512.1 kinase [Hirsutella rhossiliensis]
MEHTDIIARVYPVLDMRDAAKNAIQGSRLYVPALHQPQQPAQRGLFERRPMEPANDTDFPGDHGLPFIELRLSDIPRTHHGIVFGRDPQSDVVLPEQYGASYHHFALTFDAAKRLIVMGFDTLVGTEVTYDNDGGGKRRNFQWIVSGGSRLSSVKAIIVTVNKGLKFRIVAAKHNTSSPEYIEQVNRFCQGTATAGELFEGLNFPRRSDTELPTGVDTPGQGQEPIYLRKKIGQGAFGVVIHFWNVSTGAMFVTKQPSQLAVQGNRVDRQAWQNEANIMGRLDHPHIVRFLGSVMQPWPVLRLEFVPGLSLEHHGNISATESLSILRQCLSALKYLHGMTTPIIHRDIKPANILVHSRSSTQILVKFGDFGLSKESCDPSTMCGTPKYIAPEMYENMRPREPGHGQRLGYSPAVDIWSLGVVIYEQMGNAIVSDFRADYEERPNKLKRFLLRAMVVVAPNSRLSARDCYERVLELSNTIEGGEAPDKSLLALD